jgi:acyl carrier protein
MSNPHIGSSLESWLKEEGIFESATAKAKLAAIESWLQEWFASRGARPASDANYFEAGAIDSFGLVELIPAIEKAFPIKFHQRDFQDRRFASISGLAEIVNERLQQG